MDYIFKFEKYITSKIRYGAGLLLWIYQITTAYTPDWNNYCEYTNIPNNHCVYTK